MEEDYREKKIQVKLTRAEITRIANGEIIEGYKTRVGLSFKESVTKT